MFPYGKKISLSPKLKWGVGRGFSTHKLLRWSGSIFTLIALILTFNAVRLIWQEKASAKDTNQQPQILGAATHTPEPDTQNIFEFETYIVQKGDTLFNISQTYNINWTTLATLNNLQAPFTLKPGSSLKIPKH